MTLGRAQFLYDMADEPTTDECRDCGCSGDLNEDGYCKKCVRQNSRIEAAERAYEERR